MLEEHARMRADVRDRSPTLIGISRLGSKERKEKISVALYPSTIHLLDEACGREARSRSNLIEVILLRHFSEMREKHPEVDRSTSFDRR